MIGFFTFAGSLSRALARKQRAERERKAREAKELDRKRAQQAIHATTASAEAARRRKALTFERELARLEHEALTTLHEPSLTAKQIQARADRIRNLEEQRERLRAIIDPDGSVRAAKQAREEQLEQERLDFLASQLVRGVRV